MTAPNADMPDEELARLLDITDEELAHWYTQGKLDRYVYSDELANALAIHPLTPYKWVRQRKLAGEIVHATLTRHRYSAINGLLAAGARNFERPPMLDDLLGSTLTLLPMREVCKRLGRKSNTVLNYINDGEIQAVKLFWEWRISKESLGAFLAKRTGLGQTHLSRYLVTVVTGYGLTTILQLVTAGTLRAQRSKSGSEHERPIEISSLLAFLPSVLPEWIDAREWLTARLRELEPPVRQSVAAEHVGVTIAGLHDLMNTPPASRPRLAYIKSPGGGQGTRRYVPASSIQAYVATLPPLSDDDVEVALGIEKGLVPLWRAEERLICPLPLHDHRGMGLKSPCTTALWHQQRRR